MKERILILFGADSKLEWGRSYQWAKAFSRLGHEVFYVDLPESITHVFSSAPSRADGFNVFTPKYGLPYNRVKLLKPINKRVILSQIKRALSKSGFRPTIIWVYSPYEPWIAKALRYAFKPKSVVYDCGDDRVAMAEQNHGEEAGARVRLMEEELAGYCDALFTETDTLKVRKDYMHKRVFTLENGIDVDMFSPDANPPMPVEYAGMNGRIVLYTGTVAVWVDVELIRACAERYPDDSFVLVGPSVVDISILKGVENIHLLGPRPYREMPAYIRHSCVDLIPFKPAKSLMATLKALQYASMGKPVLSTYYEGVNDYGGLVAIASGGEEFIKKIGDLASSWEPMDRAKMKIVLDAYSWETIAAKGLELLGIEKM